jgi:hypothetical protein
MFIVEGLPDKHIPVPAQTVLTAYLEGDSKSMVEYLKEQLTHTHMVGNYMVSVGADIVDDHVHDDCVRIPNLPTTLLIYTGEA